MKLFAVLALTAALAVPAFAGTYSTDFEDGDLTGWTITTPMQDWADQGGMTANVVDGPTGGKALKLEWGTDWASYWISSGGITSPLLSGFDPDNGSCVIEFDMYRTHNGIHQWFDGGNGETAVGMWPWYDHPGNAKMGWNSDAPLDFLPDNAWVHFSTSFDAATDVFTTTVSHEVPGYDKADPTTPWYGGTYTGAITNSITGQWNFLGTAVAAEMREGRGLRAEYDNATYIDNFTISATTPAVPEPGSLLALASGLIGIGGYAIRRRK